ncbi:MAG: hypothetical protein U0790_29170 [Isosphaeraceae bacterium]
MHPLQLPPSLRRDETLEEFLRLARPSLASLPKTTGLGNGIPPRPWNA